MIRLNIGCGEYRMEGDGFINIDCVSQGDVKPDLILDIKKSLLPWKDGEVDEIYMIHTIEHIEMRFWNHIFNEFSRVLNEQGKILLAYPEFSKCARRFMEDTNGLRDFWRATLYGRQLYPSDYHVCPMDSKELSEILKEFGFTKVNYQEESDNPFNTELVACK